MNKWTRRAFVGAGTVAGGGFLLGAGCFTFAPSRHSLVATGIRVRQLPVKNTPLTASTS